MKRSERGQSVLEYVLILTAIIAVIAIAAQGPIRAAVDNLMDRAAGTITTAADKLP